MRIGMVDEGADRQKGVSCTFAGVAAEFLSKEKAQTDAKCGAGSGDKADFRDGQAVWWS